MVCYIMEAWLEPKSKSLRWIQSFQLSVSHLDCKTYVDVRSCMCFIIIIVYDYHYIYFFSDYKYMLTFENAKAEA